MAVVPSEGWPHRPLSRFWTRVLLCSKHDFYPDYSGDTIACTCGKAYESHCRKCKAYLTKDPCGEQSGVSGWPVARWRRHAQ